MLYVEWMSGGNIRGRVHLASSRLKTLCGRPIPSKATNTETRPRDKTRICKPCLAIEEEQRRYVQWLK
jgi:hypothetical protein